MLVATIACLTLAAGFAWAQTSSGFFDPFDVFDDARWTKVDRPFGYGQLSSQNIGISDGNLSIKLPADTRDGGEVVSGAEYGYGSYRARMKTPYAPSSITAFFLYKAPDYQSEIDVELYNDGSRRVMFSTYSGGRQTHTQRVKLPFDPAEGFHEYRFDYASGSVSFYADDRLMKRWKHGIPKGPMNLYVNAWYPTWLEGTAPSTDAFVYVDSIRYTSS